MAETPSYNSAVAQLYDLGHELARTPSHKFDLAHMRALLVAMGNPQQRFRSVLIAGTNGKGSTAATLASILRSAGHRTGLYTSPHLVRINERIRIDDAEITDAAFVQAHERVEAAATPLVASGALPGHPSFFETMTAMAFHHFAQNLVEVAVLEVGVGGRLDATNVVEPVISIITDIALDHQKFLGNTVREIAREKAGIMRPGGVVVTLPQHPEANDVIGNTILDSTARGVSAVPYVPPVTPAASTDAAYTLSVLGEEIQVESPLPGRHQLRNVALAIAAAVELNQVGIHISAPQIARGVRETRWPGRLQIIPGAPELVLDVAHNPAGAWALRAALSQRYDERPLTFLFGIMRDKAMAEVAEILFPLADRILATQPGNPRAATPAEIQQAASRTAAEIIPEPSVRAALDRARELTGPEGVVVVTGSIYLVGEVLALLENSPR